MFIYLIILFQIRTILFSTAVILYIKNNIRLHLWKYSTWSAIYRI